VKSAICDCIVASCVIYLVIKFLKSSKLALMQIWGNWEVTIKGGTFDWKCVCVCTRMCVHVGVNI